jgi:hypothetical protein
MNIDLFFLQQENRFFKKWKEAQIKIANSFAYLKYLKFL